MTILNSLCPIVQNTLRQILPAPIVSELISFVFYDNHPCDLRKIDIIVYTSSRHLMEYYKRQVVKTFNLGIDNVRSMNIFRNSKSELFYLVLSKNTLYIVSRKAEVMIIKEVVYNVNEISISDDECNGLPVLKVYCAHQREPIFFDDNFENKSDKTDYINTLFKNTEPKLINSIMRKYSDLNFCLNKNEKLLNESMSLRQGTSFSFYKNVNDKQQNTISPSSSDNKLADNIKVRAKIPFTLKCNNKLILTVYVVNENTESVEDVHILIHGPACESMVYKTLLYRRCVESPFWTECPENILESGIETAVVVVMDYKEIQKHNSKNIIINELLFFKKGNAYGTIVFDEFQVKAGILLTDTLDILSFCSTNDIDVILSIMASTEKISLRLTHVDKNSEEDKDALVSDLFINYMLMEKLLGLENTLIYKKSPYHVLNGLVIIFHNREEFEIHYPITVFYNSVYQLLELIRLASELIPDRMVFSCYNHHVMSMREDLSIFDTSFDKPETSYQSEYLATFDAQIGILLKYLERCEAERKHEVDDTNVELESGKNIDVFALGPTLFCETRELVLRHALRGFGLMNLHDDIQDDSVCE